MAVVTVRTCDLHDDQAAGVDAQQTVRFTVDGTDYEIDCCAPHTQQFRDAVAAFIRRARRRPGQTRGRLPKGVALPMAAMELPILETLAECGGTARAAEVINAVGDKLAGRLGAADHDRLSNGDIRWRNRAGQTRQRLLDRGEMRRPTHGVWEITDHGRQRLRDRQP